MEGEGEGETTGETEVTVIIEVTVVTVLIAETVVTVVIAATVVIAETAETVKIVVTAGTVETVETVKIVTDQRMETANPAEEIAEVDQEMSHMMTAMIENRMIGEMVAVIDTKGGEYYNI